MISTGQREHHQAVGTSSVNVVSRLYKPLTVEIPAVTRPLHAGGKQVGSASPSARSQVCPTLTLSSSSAMEAFFLRQPSCSYVTTQSSLQSLGVDIRNMTALIRPQTFSKALAGGPSYLKQLLIVWWWRKCRGPISALLSAPGQEWPARLLLLSISWWQAGLQIPQVLRSCHRYVILKGTFHLFQREILFPVAFALI